MLNKSQIVEKMESYLRDNLEEARDIVAQANSWDGSLEELAVYDMNEFDDIIEAIDLSPTELICKVQYGDFNPNDDYFTFDSLENLVSYQEYEYEELIRENIAEIVERYIDISGHIYADAEMEALMEAYDEIDYDC